MLRGKQPLRGYSHWARIVPTVSTAMVRHSLIHWGPLTTITTLRPASKRLEHRHPASPLLLVERCAERDRRCGICHYSVETGDVVDEAGVRRVAGGGGVQCINPYRIMSVETLGTIPGQQECPWGIVSHSTEKFPPAVTYRTRDGVSVTEYIEAIMFVSMRRCRN